MKKNIKKLSLLLASVLVLSNTAPLQAYAAEQGKSFTYAIEAGSKNLTTVLMDVENTVDIKPVGIDKLSNYRYQWQTTNPQVATVDNNGIITAHEEGTATIRLIVGDNTKFNSTGVQVVVGGKRETVTIGLPIDNNIQSYDLPLNKTIDFAFYGVVGWNTDIYSVQWKSSNTTVATVDTKGEVFPKKMGTTIISLEIISKVTNTKLVTQPVTVRVVEKANTTPTPTVTPTPTPVPKDLTFTANLVSDNSFQVTFNQPVEKNKKDFTVTEGKTPLYIEKIDWNEEKTVATVTITDYFTEKTSYQIAVTDTKKTASISAKFPVPDRIELAWSSLGEPGKAYAMNNTGYNVYPVDVKLGVKLYAGEMDVTYTYLLQGFVDYDFIRNQDPEYTYLGDAIIFREPNQTAAIKATYTFYDSKNNKTILETPYSTIKAEKAPEYKVTGIKEWTIIKENSNTPVDWDNPVQELIAGDDRYQIICLIQDNYGFTYSTHEAGITDNYVGLDDESYPFAFFNYDLEFEASEDKKYEVGRDGIISAEEKVSKASITVKTTDIRGDLKKIGSVFAKISAPERLSEIRLSENKISVSSDTLDGQDTVGIGKISFNLYDQYDKMFTGEYDLELNCNNSLINAASVATIENGAIFINGEALGDFTEKSSIQFTLTDTISKTAVRFTVEIEKPAYNEEGEILVTGWALDKEGKKYDITLNSFDSGATEKVISIPIYDVSRSNVKVGLHTDRVYLGKSATTSYTTSNCAEGDIYVVILGPDNKVLSNVTNKESGLGFRMNEDTGEIELVVARGEKNNPAYMTSLESGTYTVHTTYITKNDGQKVRTAKRTTTIKLSCAIPEVIYKGVHSSETDLEVEDAEDVKEIVSELFKFSINGSNAKIVPDRIQSVKYTKNKNSVRITSLTLNIPYDGLSDTDYGYVIKLDNLNKTISIRN